MEFIVSEQNSCGRAAVSNHVQLLISSCPVGFLELLRHRLPASLDHMLAFIYLAYSMMALFYETVPAFGDTWIECLGDLGRYRMAIEDDDIRNREVWTSVARY
jgi:hypothetical protein